MKTTIIVPEYSAWLNEFLEDAFLEENHKKEIVVFRKPLGDEYLPVWFIPNDHCWFVDEMTGGGVTLDAMKGVGYDDAVMAASFADLQIEKAFRFLEVESAPVGIEARDPNVTTRVYLGNALIIRGSDMEIPLCPLTVSDLLLCLERTIPAGRKISFSLSVFMKSRYQSILYRSDLCGEVFIDTDMLDFEIPEAYERDVIAVFCWYVFRDNTINWKKMMIDFEDRVYANFRELIHDAIYAESN